MKCVIVANGIIKNYGYLKQIIEHSDMVVCADGGSRHLRKVNILPDIVIGDLDSMSQADRVFFENRNVQIIRYPVRKDASDTELAVAWAMENKADDITLTGTSGKRLDHTLANIFLMKQIAAKRIACRMVDDHNEIYLISDEIRLKGSPGDLVSIIPVTEKVSGLTLAGLEYSLEDAEIFMGTSIGISNCFTGNKAFISIKTGLLAVIKSKD